MDEKKTILISNDHYVKKFSNKGSDKMTNGIKRSPTSGFIFTLLERKEDGPKARDPLKDK